MLGNWTVNLPCKSCWALAFRHPFNLGVKMFKLEILRWENIDPMVNSKLLLSFLLKNLGD